MPFKDKEKNREYQREWAKTHKNRTTMKRKRAIVDNAKDKPCGACGVKFPPPAMDLHHLDPEQKSGHIHHIMHHSTYAALHEEIDKCVVLCSNCHRLHHAGLIAL